MDEILSRLGITWRHVTQFSQNEFWFHYSMNFAWILLIFLLSYFYRLGRGKPIFAPKPSGTRFRETWLSGRSLKNVLSRFGGARRCLWVIITGNELGVGAHFPFCLLFLPEIYGLDQQINANDILAVEQTHSLLFGPRVRIRFRRPDGGEESFEVEIRKMNDFFQALAALRANPTSSRIV